MGKPVDDEHRGSSAVDHDAQQRPQKIKTFLDMNIVIVSWSPRALSTRTIGITFRRGKRSLDGKGSRQAVNPRYHHHFLLSVKENVVIMAQRKKTKMQKEKVRHGRPGK